MKRSFPFLSTAALLLASTLYAPPSLAQPSDARALAAAHTLHEQAVKALDAKDFAVACPKLEEVVRLIPEGLGARLSLAECYEGADRLASAWTTYLVVENAAAQAHQIDRQKKAHERAAALQPRLAHLTLVVPATVRALHDLQVRGDGVVMGPAQWEVALPVDKGVHVFSAIARGEKAWEKGVSVPQDGVEITAFLEDPPSAFQPIATAARAPDPVAPPPPSPAPPSTAMRTAGLVIGAIGLVGVGVGSGAGLRAIAAKSASGAHCHAGDRCDATGIDLRAQSLTAGTWSTAMFVAGGVALAAGVTLVVLAPSAPRAPDVKAAIGPGTVALTGSF
ncbi:MAG: hypothetical protein ABJE95_31165 [Byssovorax sp.]